MKFQMCFLLMLMLMAFLFSWPSAGAETDKKFRISSIAGLPCFVISEVTEGETFSNRQERARCRLKAESGDPKAMYDMAVEYEGAARTSITNARANYEEATQWLQKAAAAGHAKAMNLLGLYCYHGSGSATNYVDAAKWYTKAVSLGDACAMSNLGACYHEGNGVQQDYDKAVKLFKQAAELGEYSAMANLFCCYSQGHGVKKDEEDAKKWLIKSLKVWE